MTTSTLVRELYAPVPFAAPQVFGLHPDDQDTMNLLVRQWAHRLPRNLQRMHYFDAKNGLKDLAVSLPPELVDLLEVVSGWPAKAVYELANRIVLDGVRGPDLEDRDPLGLASIMDDNRFGIEFPQAVASMLSQSVSFISTTPGDTTVGEPEVLIQFHSALWSTGLWDRRSRSLRAGLVVNELDGMGLPIRFTLMLPGQTVVCSKGAGWFVDDAQATYLGPRVPIEMMPFRPTLERPFGRSRIDRPVMSLADRAMRAAARLEVHSELFSAIKLILLGAAEDAFQDRNGNPTPLWSFYMGRLNTLTKDEDGDLPKLEQIAAQSPEPHVAVQRQLAAEFSGHTGVPLGSLGIATDNPESAGAKQEARQDIIGDAEASHLVLTSALRRTAATALMLRDGLVEPPAELRDLQFRWRPPNRPTLASLADAGAKQVASVPMLADTEVGLELIGLDAGQIERVAVERRRASAGTVLDRVLAAREQANQTEATGDQQG